VVFTPVVCVCVDLLFDFVLDCRLDPVVLAAGVVVESVLAELLLFPDELRIARNATITAINAKGAKKRAGLLLAR
jgi:hypothetical protein